MSKDKPTTIEPVGNVPQGSFDTYDLASALQCAASKPIELPDIVRITNLPAGIKLAANVPYVSGEPRPKIPGYGYGSSVPGAPEGPQFTIEYAILDPVKFQKELGDSVEIDISLRGCRTSAKGAGNIDSGNGFGATIAEELPLSAANPCGSVVANLPDLPTVTGDASRDPKVFQYVLTLGGWSKTTRKHYVLDQTVITLTSNEVPPAPATGTCVAKVAGTIQEATATATTIAQQIDGLLAGPATPQGGTTDSKYGLIVTSPLQNDSWSIGGSYTVTWTMSDLEYVKQYFGDTLSIGLAKGTYPAGPTNTSPEIILVDSVPVSNLSASVTLSKDLIPMLIDWTLFIKSDTIGNGVAVPITIAASGGRRKKTRKAKKGKKGTKVSRRR